MANGKRPFLNEADSIFSFVRGSGELVGRRKFVSFKIRLVFARKNLRRARVVIVPLVVAPWVARGGVVAAR